MMGMANLIAMDVETPRIDDGCSLEKFFIKDVYKFLNGIIPNY